MLTNILVTLVWLAVAWLAVMMTIGGVRRPPVSHLLSSARMLSMFFGAVIVLAPIYLIAGKAIYGDDIKEPWSLILVFAFAAPLLMAGMPWLCLLIALSIRLNNALVHHFRNHIPLEHDLSRPQLSAWYRRMRWVHAALFAIRGINEHEIRSAMIDGTQHAT